MLQYSQVIKLLLLFIIPTVCGANVTCITNLVAHETVKYEDEESLKTVEDREEVSHEDGLGVDVEETEHPCQAE